MKSHTVIAVTCLLATQSSHPSAIGYPEDEKALNANLWEEETSKFKINLKTIEAEASIFEKHYIKNIQKIGMR